MIPIDYALAFLWCALLFINKAAIVPLFILTVYLITFQILDSAFAINCIAALCYFRCAAWPIKMPADLRYALLCFGCLYFVAAVDDLVYIYLGISTIYYNRLPCLVVVLNALIAAMLIRDGGANFVRVTDGLRRIVNYCSIRV